MSSIRESSSDSEASESSIEIQTSPAPRGLITKETFIGSIHELNTFLSQFFFQVTWNEPNRSGSSHSIQSNGSGPGNSSHKSKGQYFQTRAEAPIKDARASTSSQKLARTFETLI